MHWTMGSIENPMNDSFFFFLTKCKMYFLIKTFKNGWSVRDAFLGLESGHPCLLRTRPSDDDVRRRSGRVRSTHVSVNRFMQSSSNSW